MWNSKTWVPISEILSRLSADGRINVTVYDSMSHRNWCTRQAIILKPAVVLLRHAQPPDLE